MYAVVGTPGQLNVATSFEVFPIRRALITEIFPIVIQGERSTPRRGVELGFEFTKRCEVSGFRSNGRQGHKDHLLVCEPGISQSLKDKRKVLFDVRNRNSRKQLGNGFGSDARNRRRSASRSSC